MPDETPDSYATAIVQAQQLVRTGRLADPDEHFPYKHAAVTGLVEENPPAGPNGPDDDTVRVEDFMSQEIADATRDYVEAQEAFLRDPGDGTRAAYDATRDALVAARRAHRVNRTDENGDPIPTITAMPRRARRAGE